MMDEVPPRVVDAYRTLRLEALRLFKECGREVAATIPEGVSCADIDEAVVTATDDHPILAAVAECGAIVHAASEPYCEEHALRNTPYDEDALRMNDDNLDVSPQVLASCILEHYAREALKETEG